MSFIARALETHFRSDDHFTEARELETPRHPIAISHRQMGEQPTTLRFSVDQVAKVTGTKYCRVTMDGEDQPLFHITPKSMSTSWRREVTDGSGLPLLDLRTSQTSRSRFYYCQLPGEQPGACARRGRHLLEASLLGYFMSDAMDIHFDNIQKLNDTKGEDLSKYRQVVLQIRGQKDTSRIFTRVICNSQHIASFRRLQLDDESLKKDWFQMLEATVAPNVDLALIAVIGAMLVDLMPQGVEFGRKWMNPQPTEATLAMARRGWKPPLDPPRYRDAVAASSTPSNG